ncbi:carbamoyltransferase C-terminal domain-containing protein [Streptomyces sp. NPDC015127]|uniref:carbamoyltransferase C-terminal domain-containing protein n=1 Tax=Streptomyces sp. NPDC015127 TaxID=3364939 RepID=UPI0036F547B2
MVNALRAGQYSDVLTTRGSGRTVCRTRLVLRCRPDHPPPPAEGTCSPPYCPMTSWSRGNGDPSADRRSLGAAPRLAAGDGGAARIPCPARPRAGSGAHGGRAARGAPHRRLGVGPRALDPRPPRPRRHAATRDRLNAIKKRAPYRPFAPAVLAEHATEWFMSAGDPSMNRVAHVRRCRADRIAAVTHHDGTARVQTVAADHQGLRELLEQFRDRTGLPLLLNTSFNRKGTPILRTGERSAAELWILVLLPCMRSRRNPSDPRSRGHRR